jgi:hypothetical protein
MIVIFQKKSIPGLGLGVLKNHTQLTLAGRDLPTPARGPPIFFINSEEPLVRALFMEKHGQVEFALDAIIWSAEDGVVEMSSVSRSQTSSI